ncbi:MAG: DsbA family protein [Aridibacter famidurans]|nr:DsbA family protein [Aridibacter famidurans]
MKPLSVISRRFFFVFVIALAAFGSAFGQQPVSATIEDQPGRGPDVFSGMERSAIEKIVSDYLVRNPSVIRDAMQALEIQEQREKELRISESLKANRQQLYADPDSPVAGNAAGDVSVVVFLDYNCGYCRSTLPHLQSIADSDPGVRIIFKEFPILGMQSHTAALAALAAKRQGKYLDFHNELLTTDSTGEGSIRQISQRLGLDFERLQKDMADPELSDQIRRNLQLAASLSINGTPAYIVGDQMIPGALDLESLKTFIAIARAKAEQNSGPVGPSVEGKK